MSAILFAACEPGQRDVDPAAPVQIIPSTETVRLDQQGGKAGFNIEIRLENTSTHGILWSACGLSLERNQYIMAMDRRSEEWLEVWRPSCPDSDDARNVLRPGESASIPLQVSSGDATNFHGEPGVYRVRLFLSSEIEGEYHQLSPELTVSRVFTIVDQPST